MLAAFKGGVWDGAVLIGKEEQHSARLIAVNLLKPTMRRDEQVSVEKVFDLMSELLSGLCDLRD